MSESLSSPWISNYLIDLAENYGAQIYNAPISTKRRRVQLTDFLTYQEDSYIWAWISDKEHRVSVRISKDAVDQYNSSHSHPLINSRFYPVFIGDYRPMFAPRPLGANMVGNTSVSHLSLDVGFIKQIGPGTHPYGSPCDLESNEKLKLWILGLRQDGGGGNILKLRKQEEAAQSRPPASPKPQPRLVPQAPTSPKLTTKVTDVPTTKPARPQDFRRVYDKRWRSIALDPWKFAVNRAVEEPLKEIAPPPIYPTTENTFEALRGLARTPSPKPISRPGTPSNWSPSIRGSPVPAHTHSPENGEQQREEADVLPTAVQLSPDAEGIVLTEPVVVVTSQGTSSIQPPTPAQRIRRSLPPRSSSPRSSPDRSVRSPLCASSPLPSSPPLPSSSLPHPSSSLPMTLVIRKNIQRKVPRPDIPLPRSDANKDGPAQILVPNSDTSGTASSQSYSQSQHLPQSQQSQPRSQSHAPAFPSSLAKEFKPPYASTPKVQTPRRTSKMFAEHLSVLSNIEEQATTSADDVHATEKDVVDTPKGSRSDGLPAPSAPQIEVLRLDEVGSDEEIDKPQLTHRTRIEAEADTWTSIQDEVDGNTDTEADREVNQLSDDDAEIDSRLQAVPSRPCSPSAVSAKPQLSPEKPGINGNSFQLSPQPSEKPVSQSTMHSLFSDSFGEELTLPSQALPAAAITVSRPEFETEVKVRPHHIPTHDPDAWKEPSFMSRDKGKGKARAVDQKPEPETPITIVGRKRLRSTPPQSPVAKRPKVVPYEELERKIRSIDRPPAAPSETTETTSQSRASQQSKRRLVNFLVDFENIDLGRGVPMPLLDWNQDMLSGLLRTGRIRTLGDEVLQDGSVYINQK